MIKRAIAQRNSGGTGWPTQLIVRPRSDSVADKRRARGSVRANVDGTSTLFDREPGRRHPTRIAAFNTTEGWSRDVTADVADELRRRFGGDLSPSLLKFLERAARH